MGKKSKEVAMAGMLTALAVVILFMGSLVELLELSAAALAALAVMVAVIELGNGKAFAVYLASALLSVLLFPKTASIVFATFVGFYPVLKVYLDKIPSKVLQYAVKLVLFNGFLVLILWITETLLGLSSDWGSLGKALFLLGNGAFILYDFAIGRLAVFYIVKIKNRIRKH